ncbi:HAMP domain-containing sensor histidine kinase [Streptomyces sp. NPDC001941]|uniref:sensor histidine kinase n=1 Tax=Streptomyces sp. NPDC001941 TaxID=3154659 RepID=UPI00332DC5AC
MRHPRRLSIHTRLVAGFAVVLLVTGVLMVTAVYLGVRYLPTYDLSVPLSSVTPQAVPGLPREHVPPGTDLDPRQGERYARTAVVRTKEDVWSTVLMVSVGGSAIAAGLGLLGGWYWSRRLLAPLHTINRAASRAGEGDLAYRINAEGPDDELKQLADTFDDTLARLERSFEAHQRFAANASHELLTPLATTRTALQIAAQDPEGREFARLLPKLQATNDRSIDIVHGLLQLAGAEHSRPEFGTVDLTELAGRACRESAATARARGLRLESDLDGDLLVTGNPVLLGQLLRNLLDNALTYNVTDGWVRVAAFASDGTTLEVSNSGARLEAEHVDRMFEPFYRRASRVHSDRSGHGLGLAIAEGIVRAHHGTITATANADGGVTIRVVLPTAEDLFAP